MNDFVVWTLFLISWSFNSRWAFHLIAVKPGRFWFDDSSRLFAFLMLTDCIIVLNLFNNGSNNNNQPSSPSFTRPFRQSIIRLFAIYCVSYAHSKCIQTLSTQYLIRRKCIHRNHNSPVEINVYNSSQPILTHSCGIDALALSSGEIIILFSADGQTVAVLKSSW